MDREKLCIEVEAPATIYEVEEVQDSEEEDEESAQSQVTPENTATARPLRQLSLLDLFRPQQ